MPRATRRSSSRVSHAALHLVLMRATIALSSATTLAFVACAGRVAESDRVDDGGAEHDDAAPPVVSTDAAAAPTPDASDGAVSVDAQPPVCDGRIPDDAGSRRCFLGAAGAGAYSRGFDLVACGLLDSGTTCAEFCIAQNPDLGDGGAAAKCAGGTATASCYCGDTAGRRPEALVLAPRTMRALGDFYAASAEAEAASVDAFDILELELSTHGAPERLLRAARAAARDEIRHAEVMTALAAARGAAPRPTLVPRGPARSLEAIALENAVAGCVAETYAALLAQWQAAHAQDPAVASAMTDIARDEARHASLAWRTHEWLLEQLPLDARARVTTTLDDALRELPSRVADGCVPEHTIAGLPTAREARALAVALVRTLSPPRPPTASPPSSPPA